MWAANRLTRSTPSHLPLLTPWGSQAAVDVDPASGPLRTRILAVIALGGMIGASARYGLARWVPTRPGHFPWATFWTNLSGSLLLGVLLVLVLERLRPTAYVRPFAATGILGAFTTMSTYQVETALLLKDGHLLTAAVYGLGSPAAGILLAFAGMRAARLGSRR